MQPAPTSPPHPRLEPQPGTGTDGAPGPHHGTGHQAAPGAELGTGPAPVPGRPVGDATLLCLAAAGTDTEALLERARHLSARAAAVLTLPTTADGRP